MVLCDSDADIAQPLLHAVERHGMRATWCRDGASALLEVGALAPTVLVIADQIDGAVGAAEVVATVRDHTGVPVLVGADPTTKPTPGARLPWAVLQSSPDRMMRPQSSPSQAMAPHRSSTEKLRGSADGQHAQPRGAGARQATSCLLDESSMSWCTWSGNEAGSRAANRSVRRCGGVRQTRTPWRSTSSGCAPNSETDIEHGPLIRTIRGAGYRLAPTICG